MTVTGSTTLGQIAQATGQGRLRLAVRLRPGFRALDALRAALAQAVAR